MNLAQVELVLLDSVREYTIMESSSNILSRTEVCYKPISDAIYINTKTEFFVSVKEEGYIFRRLLTNNEIGTKWGHSGFHASLNAALAQPDTKIVPFEETIS